MAASHLRKILAGLGYKIVERRDTWSECYVATDSEQWRGRGLDDEEALSDAIGQMLPSGLARDLFEDYVAAGVAESPAFGLPGAPLGSRALLASHALPASALVKMGDNPMPAANAPPAPRAVEPPPRPLVVRAAVSGHATAKHQWSLCLPERGIVAIVDGGKATAVAATATKLAAQAIAAAFDSQAALSPLRMRGMPLLLGAVERANRDIVEAARRDPKLKAMTASLAAVLAVGPHVAVTHIGTTLAYRLRAGRLEMLTRSTPPEGNGKRDTGKYVKPVPRALGVDRSADADASIVEAEAGDVFALLTDSAHPPEPRAVAEALTKSTDPAAMAAALVALARSSGTVEATSPGQGPGSVATAAVLKLEESSSDLSDPPPPAQG